MFSHNNSLCRIVKAIEMVYPRETRSKNGPMAVVVTGHFKVEQLLPARNEMMVLVEEDVHKLIDISPLDCLLTQKAFALWGEGACIILSATNLTKSIYSLF